MFDLDQLVADCRAVLGDDTAQKSVREIMKRAMSDPAAVLKAIGEPTEAGLFGLYRAPDLTILNLVWGPHMIFRPHDHRMWAVIGIYSGREDNIFWRRIPGTDGRIEAASARSLGVGDAEPLGKDIIHSVSNPIPRLTAAIHIYGGDFFAAERSEWEPERLSEGRYDIDAARLRFADSNRDPQEPVAI
jgi:predicted metal-dependent enzyme (double-stranded beta helix superfamily)